jgi:hypothetical protein
MSEHQRRPAAPTTVNAERPTPEGYTSWPSYWTAQGIPWRTEPEIGEERQKLLQAILDAQRDAMWYDFPFGELS